MKNIIRKWFAGVMSVVMVFSLLPSMARAEEDSGTPEKTTVEQVQALIDALPEAESITADNRADVEAQLTAIDEAKQDLTDDELDALDITRYMAAVEAILALDDMAGADEPVTIAMESDITYLDWDDGQKRLVEKTCDSATKVESSTTTWDNNWYVVSGRVPSVTAS